MVFGLTFKCVSVKDLDFQEHNTDRPKIEKILKKNILRTS